MRARHLGIAIWMMVLVLVVPQVGWAQLELLLRRVESSEPRAGQCGRYRFEADEPDGYRKVEFVACIESVPETADGSVVLRLWSDDSEIRVDLAPALFQGAGGALVDHIRRIEQTQDGEITILEPDDWQNLPALSPAPELPIVRDEDLGSEERTIAQSTFPCRGRRLEEAQTSDGMIGESKRTKSEHRTLETWTTPTAPILGVVFARTFVRSELVIDPPIPGVPARKPRESRYSLELLEMTQR